MSIWVSLGVIALVLTTSIVASLIVTGRRGEGDLSSASSHGS
jgi:uncharacterized membrane protein